MARTRFPATARDGHSSGTVVADRLEQPTRATSRRRVESFCKLSVAPIRFCSRRGLPCPRRCRRGGALLPHPFTLTGTSPAVCFLWRFPWGRPRRTLSGAVSPWSPDFPLHDAAAVQPTGSLEG